VTDDSMWKKEVSFGRKPKDDQTEPAAETPDTPEVEASESETASAESLWKQELTFRRKIEPELPSETQLEAEPVATEPESAEVTNVASLWKREATVESSAGAEPVADEQIVEEPVVEEPVVEPPAVTEPALAEAVAVKEPESEEPIVVDLFPDETPVVAEMSAVEPEAEAEPAAEAVPEPEPAPPVQTWSATPSVTPLHAEPEPDPAPVSIVHPPVPAEELAPVTPEKVPFWKKDISFGGGKKNKKEKPTAATVAAVVAPSAEKAPFWKKDFSFGGGKKNNKEKPTAAPVAAVVAPSAEKVPFWKKDLSFGSGKQKEKPAAAPVAEAAAPSAEKVPFWKKDLSFGGGKAPKSEKQPKAPRERKVKVPKVKLERGSGKGGKRVVGLKIGASQLAAARVSNNGSAELQQVAREPLASGIVVGGELRDPDALSAALKDFFEKHSLPKRGVRLGIANNRIGVRTFEIAGITDPKQLANAVRFRAQEALPIPIDEAVLDYQVLGDGVDEEGQPTKRILLVVAYRELIDRYVDACKKAGIVLSGIDLEAFALLRALQAPQEGVGSDPSAALVAVSIGHERSTFAVSDGRVCEFTRVLEWGGSALNVALARVLDAAPSEVEAVKHELTLTDSTIPEGLTAEQATKCVEALRKAIQTFARELVSSLQYYQNQPGSLGIGEIVLTGGTAHLPGLAGELERLIGVHVRVGDPLARMKVAKKVGDPPQIGSLAVAIGLGIED
jgi:type IV pilus assembly protein PilM